MASDKLSFIEFDDIEDQLKNMFTGTELISLTRKYAEELGKKYRLMKLIIIQKRKL